MASPRPERPLSSTHSVTDIVAKYPADKRPQHDANVDAYLRGAACDEGKEGKGTTKESSCFAVL